MYLNIYIEVYFSTYQKNKFNLLIDTLLVACKMEISALKTSLKNVSACDLSRLRYLKCRVSQAKHLITSNYIDPHKVYLNYLHLSNWYLDR